jgi:acetyltransferase-like isoleucine patch superfamily enzyme
LSAEASLIIGKSCGFSGVSIGCFDKIIIGNNVRVGANVLITDSDWHLDDPRIGEASPIIIGDNVWLGYGVTVLKGVNIGVNTIIGAHSVVVSNIPDNVIAAGNPCKIIKSIV